MQEIKLHVGDTLRVIVVGDQSRGREQKEQKALGDIRKFVRKHASKIANLESGNFDDTVGFETDAPEELASLVKNIRTAKIPKEKVIGVVAGVLSDSINPITSERAGDMAETFFPFLSKFAEGISRKKK